MDVSLEDPTGKVLYKEIKKQYDSHQWTTAMDGTYKVNFLNKLFFFTNAYRPRKLFIVHVTEKCFYIIDHSFRAELVIIFSNIFLCSFQVCFSNEFSTFSHKIVYMDWQTGNEGLQIFVCTTACLNMFVSSQFCPSEFSPNDFTFLSRSSFLR